MISNVKSSIEIIEIIKKRLGNTNKLSRYIRIFSAVIVLTGVIFPDVKAIFSLNNGDISPNIININYFVNSNIKIALIIWVVFFLAHPFARSLVFRIPCEGNIVGVIWSTIEDVLNLFPSCMFLVYAVLFLQDNTYNEMRNSVFLISFFYIMLVVIRKLYIQNSNRWFEISRDYTPFYDANGNPIPENGIVNYNGSRYKVVLIRDVLNPAMEKSRSTWYLISTYSDDKQELEDVVGDKEGKVYLIKEPWDEI